jgi:hypothetical protein
VAQYIPSTTFHRYAQNQKVGKPKIEIKIKLS